MQMKLLVVLLLVACVAVQESEAAWGGGWRPGPIGIMPRPGPIGMPRPMFGRDVARELDTNEDGYLDETELEKHISVRDVLDFIEALDQNGDNLLSTDELNKKQ
ncbi:uncharacterized protein LOC121370748 isoform X2 [Gigantopelta aegis]|nr:uncharacterized protein LOC121370748 isoform X2 [Gigantopelta aegis]